MPFSFTPYPVPLTVEPAQITILSYTKVDDPDPFLSGYQVIPNLQLLQLQYKDGLEPMTARFKYVIDVRNQEFGFPSQFEEIWPLTLTPTGYTVTPDTRLVVIITQVNGNTWVAFDGFPRLPQTDVNPEGQEVTFTAIGLPIRCFDIPIPGRVQRHGDRPYLTDVSNVFQTDRPTIFNPSSSRHPTGSPNCTPDGYDMAQDDSSKSFPVFIDDNLSIDVDGLKTTDPRSFWTLDKVVRYILSAWNDEGAVKNPMFTYFYDPDKKDGLFVERTPNGPFFDPAKPETYTANRIIMRTVDVSNHTWPEALYRILNYHNFSFRWYLGADGNFNPEWQIQFYPKDSGSGTVAPKQFMLPAYQTPLNPATANVMAMSAAFDYHGVANEFQIETALNRYEVSVILSPAFLPRHDDWRYANKKRFLKANIDQDDIDTDVRFAYRRYIAAECGDDHYVRDDEAWSLSNDPMDFREVFPADVGQDFGYVRRYRPGKRSLLSRNRTNNKFYTAQLAFSRDYAGPAPPCIWDGTGHWQPITSDWHLLDDRLGIECTAEDPNHWPIGKWTGTPKQERSTSLRGIKSLSDPSDSQSSKLFVLRLTTVIESDWTIEAYAKRRLSSPLKNRVLRRIDAKDHWRQDVVTKSSIYYDDALTLIEVGDPPGDTVRPHQDEVGDVVIHDDTTFANNHALQLQSAHEFTPMPVAITSPRFETSYMIGDQISGIAGRDVSFSTNVGAGQAEAPRWPFIVAITWDFSGEGQTTNYQLSDRRMEPQPINRRSWGSGWHGAETQ